MPHSTRCYVYFFWRLVCICEHDGIGIQHAKFRLPSASGADKVMRPRGRVTGEKVAEEG